MEESDPSTIEAAKRGDLDAFDEIVRTYQVPIVRYLRGFVGDEHLAEEIAQDTFVRCFERLSGFEGRARFSTWLFRIAHNTAIDAVRARSRRRRLADEVSPPVPGTDPALQVELAAALGELSPKLREALLVIEVAGLRYREAAEVLGVPVGTVKSRVFQAREQMVRWMRSDDKGSAGAV